ncbi:MAG: sucrase ferredoxin [Pseudomonadales bacterium]
MSERIYCSEQNPEEPMIGTADRVDVWVLLEYKPTWKARAIEEGSLAADTRRWLEENLGALDRSGLKARPQLIRRPELDRDGLSLFIGTENGLLRVSGANYAAFETLRLTDVLANPDAYEAVAEPHYFVCTNGQRDVCCARFGLPLYAGLRERVGRRVWQVTHLGGHRFAPNVLVLPQGALYGRVQESSLDEFVARVEARELAFDVLRGRSWLEPEAQAAEALSRRSDLRPVGIEHAGELATVRFEDRGGETLDVLVRRDAEPLQVLKSCADEALKPVRPYLPG